MEKRRELTDEEKAKLQMEFERAQEEVDEDDVKESIHYNMNIFLDFMPCR